MKQLKFKCIFLGSAFLKYMLLFQAHWRRGLILRQKKLFRESFSAFLEGYWKGDGTVSEKLNILVEAVASFSNITGFVCYRGFENRTNCTVYLIFRYFES